MPLNKRILQRDLEKIFKDIEPKIKEDLFKKLKEPKPKHTSKGVNDVPPGKSGDPELDGGVIENKTNSLYQVFEEIDKWSIENQPTQNDIKTVSDRAKLKDKTWKIHAEKWSKSISENIAEEITEKMISDFCPRFANLITEYIKSATIIIPSGQAVTGATSGGTAVVAATADPSKPARIS